MHANDLYVLAGSVAVVAFMVGLAQLLGFRAPAQFAGLEAARAAILSHDPDVIILDLVMSMDMRAALARLSDGRWAIARTVGDGAGVRVFAPERVCLTRRQGELILIFADLGFPDVHVSLDVWPDWIAQRLAVAPQ